MRAAASSQAVNGAKNGAGNGHGENTEFVGECGEQVRRKERVIDGIDAYMRLSSRKGRRGGSHR